MKRFALMFTLLLLFCTALTVMAGDDALTLGSWDVTGSAETSSGGNFALDGIVGQTIADGGESVGDSGFSMENGFLNSDSSSIPTAILSSGMDSAERPLGLLALLLGTAGVLLLLTSRLARKRFEPNAG